MLRKRGTCLMTSTWITGSSTPTFYDLFAVQKTRTDFLVKNMLRDSYDFDSESCRIFSIYIAQQTGEFSSQSRTLQYGDVVETSLDDPLDLRSNHPFLLQSSTFPGDQRSRNSQRASVWFVHEMLQVQRLPSSRDLMAVVLPMKALS